MPFIRLKINVKLAIPKPKKKISVNGKHDFDCLLNQANDFEIPENDLMHLRIKSFENY
jgi:hypothetical protein